MSSRIVVASAFSQRFITLNLDEETVKSNGSAQIVRIVAGARFDQPAAAGEDRPAHGDAKNWLSGTHAGSINQVLIKMPETLLFQYETTDANNWSLKPLSWNPAAISSSGI